MQKAEFRMGLKDDGLIAHLEMLVDGAVIGWADMHASEMDSFIQALALYRAQMVEPVNLDLDERPNLIPQTDPKWAVLGSDGKASVPVALRHCGFGWLMFELPLESAAGLGHHLSLRSASQT